MGTIYEGEIDMAFQISPGVQVKEVDLSTIIPAVATTEGAFVGTFSWGPVDQIALINSQTSLVSRFGKPTSENFTHWFTASNFLDYGNSLKIIRVVDSDTAVNSSSSGGTILIKNESNYENTPINSGGHWIAKYPGAMGNALRVSICDSVAGQFSNTLSGFSANVVQGEREVTFIEGSTHSNEFAVGDIISFVATEDAPEDDFAATVDSDGRTGLSAILPSGTYKIVSKPATGGNTITVDRDFPVGAENMLISRKWEFYDNFDVAPGTSEYADSRSASLDEFHIAISDRTGQITGVKGTVLEVFSNVSKAADAKNSDGTTNYYKDIINNQSQWIWAGEDITGTSVSSDVANKYALGDTIVPGQVKSFVQISEFNLNSEGIIPLVSDLRGGANGNATTPGPFQLGYDMFNNPEEIDISLVLCGPHDGTISRYIIDNLVESRKDCVAFLSPQQTDCVNVPNLDTVTTNIKNYRNTTDGINGRSSSYAVMDSGWKYQYDKFNDVYRWVPLNADIAGLCVNTDNVRDPWFSPAGLNRGQLKNVVKLAWNPRRTHRDELYKNGINPVVTLPGQGTVLFGDKTLQSKPSAFDRINVRRLFIVLEKAIATAAKYTLFEFNDEFTRAQFRNLVEPFLRDVQGRRGIYDFRVVCDTTNNTPEVIDRNEFVGDIYIKPARSINFITLNFIATRTGVDFDEIVGQF